MVWDAYHTLLYNPAAPGSVQKAAVMDPRRVVTGRLAGRKEELSGQAAVKIPRGRCDEDHVVAGAESGVIGRTRVLGSCGVEMSFACPQTVNGALSLALNAPRFILVGAARRRPLEGRSLLRCTFIDTKTY
jgi:hypothetical protein